MVIGKKIDDHLAALSSIRPEQVRAVMALREKDFHFCLFGIHSGTCFSVMNLLITELPAFLDSLQEKGKDFPEVNLFLCNPEVSLIPAAIFQESDALEFLRQIHGGTMEQCISQRMDHLSSYLMFSVRASLKEQWMSTFPQSEIHHIIEILLHAEEAELQFKGPGRLRAHMEGKTLYLLAYEGKALTFFNSFQSQGPTDTLYYILHSMDSLGMDYQETELHLTGVNAEMEETENILNSYCPLIQTAKDLRPEHQVLGLLSKHQLCVS